MFKIGERVVTLKEIIMAGLLILVALAAVWAMVFAKPKPIISRAPQPSAAGLVLLQGGTPGSGPGQFAYPRGIAVNSKGELFVADSKNHRIQRFSAKNWQFESEFGGYGNVGGGDAKKLAATLPGKLNEPNGIAIGADDTIYVADTWNERIQVFNKNGTQKMAFAADDGFWGPREVGVDANGFIYVADTGKHRVIKFDPKGQKIRTWCGVDPKTGAPVPGSKPGEFNEPIGLAVDASGNLYVADRLNFRIQVFGPEGQALRQWPVKGWAKEQVDMEPHLALDKAKQILYVTDGKGTQVLCYHLDGTPISTIAKDSAGNDLFRVPLGVAVNVDGNLLVVDAGAGMIFKIKGQ
jgi:DNA-binding beta-propeller fold protein YncE